MIVSHEKTLHLTHMQQGERRFSNTDAAIAGLELPALSPEAIEHDLSLAPHLKALREVRLEQTGACCVIQCDNEDLGLLAAAYLAARHGAVYDTDPLDLHDYMASHDTDMVEDIDENRELVLLQNGFLPLHRVVSEVSFFDPMPTSDTFVPTARGRSFRLNSWNTMTTSHPILLIPGMVSDETLLQEVGRQTAMRSLTIILLPSAGIRNCGGAFGYQPQSCLSLACELQFTFAAELVTLHQPAPTCSYNQLVLTQLLRESGLELDPHCRAKTLLKALNEFRARHDGVTNDNIHKYVRLLRHMYPLQPGEALTRQQALKPLDRAALRPRTPKRERDRIHLYGCENVKRQLRSVADTMKVNQLRRSNHLPAPDHGQVLLFAGAPGTGKTTAARMLQQWLEEEDLLDNSIEMDGSYFQISGAQLKAPFVGQTAPLIHDLFANHSFLFIDEAYALAESGLAGVNNDHFAQEAMGQLCIELENLPADHVVIFAGYGGDHDNRMRAFLNANPGLSSRITRTIRFDPYTPDKELPEIFAQLVQEQGLVLPARWQSVAVPFFRRRAAQEDFGSGREARRLLESCLLAQSHRLAQETNYRLAAMTLLTMEDLRKAVADLDAGFDALQDSQTLRCGLGLARTATRETGQ